jgi:hypothetical protein
VPEVGGGVGGEEDEPLPPHPAKARRSEKISRRARDAFALLRPLRVKRVGWISDNRAYTLPRFKKEAIISLRIELPPTFS